MVVPTKGTPRDMGPALQALDRLLNRREREREARRALQRRNLNELQEINELGRVMYYVRVSTTGGMKKVPDQVMATTVDELVGVWLNDEGREGDMVSLVAGVLQCAQSNPHREITMHMSSQQQDRGIADTSGVGEESDTDSDDEFRARKDVTSTPVMPGNTHSFHPQRDPALLVPRYNPNIPPCGQPIYPTQSGYHAPLIRDAGSTIVMTRRQSIKIFPGTTQPLLKEKLLGMPLRQEKCTEKRG